VVHADRDGRDAGDESEKRAVRHRFLSAGREKRRPLKEPAGGQVDRGTR
jgi:hypothetical protein